MELSKRINHFGIVFVVVAGASSIADVAQANDNNCGGATVAANATLDVSSVTSVVEAISPDGGAYACGACQRFVVDVKLPASMTGKVLQLTSSMVDAIDTKGKCEAAQSTFHYFRKAAGATTFTGVGGGTSRGSWVQSSGGFLQPAAGTWMCSMSPTTGYTQPTVSAVTGDSWRVAISAVVHTLPVRVKVTAQALTPQGPKG